MGNEIAEIAPYDAEDDFAKSINVGYEAVRERRASSGLTWTTKARAPTGTDLAPVSGTELR
jgi:hypothetical protein